MEKSVAENAILQAAETTGFESALSVAASLVNSEFSVEVGGLRIVGTELEKFMSHAVERLVMTGHHYHVRMLAFDDSKFYVVYAYSSDKTLADRVKENLPASTAIAAITSRIIPLWDEGGAFKEAVDTAVSQAKFVMNLAKYFTK